MPNLDLIYTETTDHLQLPGAYYIPESKTDICLLMVHGMSGNILENYAFNVLGKTAAQAGIAAIYSHNRGYNHINDISLLNTTTPNGGYQTVRLGVQNERFKDCLLDIEAWLSQAHDLGYQRIILLGHSLGGPKVVHYMYLKTPPEIIGVVLASPGDMVGNIQKYQPNYQEIISQAQALIAKGQPGQILPDLIWDYYHLSAQTFLDFFTDGGPADNLPILRNPTDFPELACITQPILCLFGENDDSVNKSITEDLAILNSKAVGTKSFTKAIIPGANHTYDRAETEFAQVVVDWIRNISR